MTPVSFLPGRVCVCARAFELWKGATAPVLYLMFYSVGLKLKGDLQKEPKEISKFGYGLRGAVEGTDQLAKGHGEECGILFERYLDGENV